MNPTSGSLNASLNASTEAPVATDAPVAPPPSAPSAAPAARPWAVFAVAAVAAFLVSMDATVLYAAFAALSAGFPGHPPSTLSWVLNGYTVTYAALLIPAGAWADAQGRRRAFQTGLLLFALASWACGAAPNLPLLVAARVAQAAGAALLTPASLGLVLAAFPPAQRTVAIGLWGAVGGLAAAFGPGLGSVLVDTVGWPWAFYLNLPLALGAGLASRRLLPADAPGRRAPIDGPGTLLLMVAVGLLALGIAKVEDPSWSAGACATALGGAAAAALAFLAWARHTPTPVLDLALFEAPGARWANAAMLCFATAFAMMFFAFFLHLRQVWHYGTVAAGLAVMPGPLTVVVVAMVGGRWASRHGHARLLRAGSLAYAAAGVWFALSVGDTPNYLGGWLPGLLLSGTGVGLLMPGLAASAVIGLPPARLALGSAVNQAVRHVGTVLGVAVVVGLGLPLATQHQGFLVAYGLQIALALATGALCWPLHRRARGVQDRG